MDDAATYAAPTPLAVVHRARSFPARRERVFQAWTDPVAVSRWFGPPFDPPPTVTADLCVGGRYTITWTPATGGHATLSGVYLEVDPPARLVYTFGWDGVPDVRGMGDSKVTVEFRDLGDATEVRLTHELLDEERVLAFHRLGWDTSLDRLETVLA